MPVRIVQSKQNARLKELRRALSAGGRKSAGLVGIEGPNLVEEALRANLRIQCIFAGDGLQSWVARLPLSSEIEVIVVPMGILTSILATETPQPIAALAEPPKWKWSNLFVPGRGASPLLVVLAGLQDPGNLGTILRAAEAFGATGVVSLPGTVNEWNPKSVRASAGSVFRLPTLSVAADECFARLREAGVTVLTTELRDGTPAHHVDLTRPTAVLIGNEGNGVPEDLAKQADGSITIPCPGSVESLNAAMAAGILLYEASRQRSAQTMLGKKP